jgi:hypothetical protein
LRSPVLKERRDHLKNELKPKQETDQRQCKPPPLERLKKTLQICIKMMPLFEKNAYDIIFNLHLDVFLFWHHPDFVTAPECAYNAYYLSIGVISKSAAELTSL